MGQQSRLRNSPIFTAIGFGAIYGGVALWIASYWTSGTTLWLITLGVGGVCALLGLAVGLARIKQERRQQQAQNAQLAVLELQQQQWRQSLPALSPADMKLVEQLVRAYPGYLPRREGIVTDIGEELNSRGGNELMLAAHEQISKRLGSVAARELEVAWDGIGEWQG